MLIFSVGESEVKREEGLLFAGDMVMFIEHNKNTADSAMRGKEQNIP